MEPLIPECSYHIYNHSNGNDLLFKEEKNYFYFLERYKKFISPVANTYAYCLMPNHFHIIVKIRKEKEIVLELRSDKAKEKYNKLEIVSDKENFISLFVSKQFSNLFSSYSQAFNKMYNRKGSLFIKNFKRKLIDNDMYFLKLINYVHLNPVVHGFVQNVEEWRFSSYNAILSDGQTLVKREEVIALFDDLDNFKYCHLEPMEI